MMQDENIPKENKETADFEKIEPPHTIGDVIHPSNTSNNDVAAPKDNQEPKAILTEDDKESEKISETPAPEKPNDLLAIPPQPVKKKSKKGILILVLVLLLAGGAAAAWQLTKNKKGSNNTQDKTVQETQDIDVLRIGTVEGPASTYFPNEELLGIYSGLNRQIYEGLVGFEENKIAPLIAQSWTNPDEKTWIFKIRPNIKFHTGNPVNAQVLKTSIDDLKQFDYWSLFVSTIESVEATGDLELTIKTTEPDPLLLNKLTQAYIRDTTAPDAEGRNGTGAYHADSTATNDENSTTLVAFDDYYGGHVKTRKLIYTIFKTDDEIVTAIKDKKVDIMETLAFPAINKELTEAGFSTVAFEAPGVFGIYLNIARTNTTVLKNKDIRLAIAQAIDRQSLVDKLGNKNTPTDQVIPKSLPGHDPSISMPGFDIAAAKATLAKAGYKNTPLEFLYVQDIQLDPPIIIDQLKAAGFNIKAKVYPGDDLDKGLAELRSGKWDIFAAGYTSDVLDARDVLGSLLHSTEASYGQYSDPVYDKLLSDSDKEFDPVKRTQLLQQANKYIADNIIWIPTRNSIYNAYYGKDLDIKVDFLAGGSLGAYYHKVGRLAQ